MTNIDQICIQMAREMSTISKANRKKVGAVLLTKNGVILPGVNGQPAGWDNACEDENGNTKTTVIHAETNCILKAAKEGVSIIGATIYVTLSPCNTCSAMLAQSGIARIVYDEEYRDPSGIHLLLENGILIQKF